MSVLTRDGVDIWYEVRGDGEPLVLTGGFAILHEQFHKVSPIMAESFMVINWNYRGTGRSDRAQVGPLSIDDWVSDLQAVLDELDVPRAYLWSASTGALVHGRFAGLFPERVKALVMYPELRFDAANRRRFYLYGDIVDHFGWDGLAQIMSLFSSEERRSSLEGVAFIQWERDVMERNLTKAGFARVLDVVAHADVLPSLGKVGDVPILLLAGDSGPLGADDEKFARRVAEIREVAPHTEVKVIPGTGGTYSMLERPEETARLVSEYLAKL